MNKQQTFAFFENLPLNTFSSIENISMQKLSPKNAKVL